jgi:hypothetical protein
MLDLIPDLVRRDGAPATNRQPDSESAIPRPNLDWNCTSIPVLLHDQTTPRSSLLPVACVSVPFDFDGYRHATKGN